MTGSYLMKIIAFSWLYFNRIYFCSGMYFVQTTYKIVYILYTLYFIVNNSKLFKIRYKKDSLC